MKNTIYCGFQGIKYQYVGENMSFVWTDETVNNLRSLWKKGIPAREIADQLGNISRNAVIGKAHRLGLSQRVAPIRREVAPFTPMRMEKACQWPFGDPMTQSYHVCNQTTKIGKPYCEKHYNLAYRIVQHGESFHNQSAE